MDKTSTTEKISNVAFWRPVRLLLFLLLSRAARKVLLTRELQLEGGDKARWLKADFARFIDEFRLTAIDLRQTARLHALPSIGNRLMVELAVFTLAAYRTMLQQDIDRTEARQIVADIGWDVYAVLLGMTSLPFRLVSRDPGKRLRNTIRLLLWFPFNAPGPPGYEVQVWTKEEDIHTHFTHCPPHSFVRRVIDERGDKGDLEAFIASWCRYDWPGADLIADDGQRGHYVRRQALSHGDPVCDMCWAARALDARAADNETSGAEQ